MVDRTWVASRGSIVIACALAAGCSDDAGQAIDAASIDARTDAAIDAPADAAIDAPIDARVIDAPPGSCTIDGDYTTLLGKEVFFRFEESTHVWGAALSRPELANPIIDGTYTFGGNAFTIVESPDSICPATDTGQYTVVFTPACSFTLTLVADPCTDRAESLGGAMFTLLPP